MHVETMSFTEKYYDDPYCQEYQTEVWQIISKDELKPEDKSVRFGVVLQNTIFYPLGGGQPADKGQLEFSQNGITVKATVLDVRRKQGQIVHYCCGEMPTAGETVTCQLDFGRRYDHMQQHSSEHIVSGIIKDHFGFNNIGFGIGETLTTLDFDGVLTSEMIAKVELLANQVVWQNVPFLLEFPSSEALPKLDYRAKTSYAGQVRLVRVPEVDCCACCGTQVKTSAELGLIKIVNKEAYKGGTRLKLVAGGRTLAWVSELNELTTQLGQRFSLPVPRLMQGVSKLEADVLALKQEKQLWQSKWMELRLNEFKKDLSNPLLLVIEAEMSFEDLIALGKRVVAENDQSCLLLSPKTTDDSERSKVSAKTLQTWHTVIMLTATTAKQKTAKALWQSLQAQSEVTGKGGGQDVHAQGLLTASLATLQGWYDIEILNLCKRQ